MVPDIIKHASDVFQKNIKKHLFRCFISFKQGLLQCFLERFENVKTIREKEEI